MDLIEIETTRNKRTIVARHAHPAAAHQVAKRQAVPKLAPRYKRDTSATVHNRQKRSFDQSGHDRMMDIIFRKESVNADNCQDLKVSPKSHYSDYTGIYYARQ